MPIDYNEYKPIQTRLTNNDIRTVLPKLTIGQKPVFNTVTGAEATASDNSFARQGAELRARQIAKLSSLSGLREAVSNTNTTASPQVRQAAIDELARRGLAPTSQAPKLPDFPTAKSIGTPLPEVSRPVSIPKFGAATPFVPAIVGALLQKPVGDAGEAFGRAVLVPIVNKIDEFLGLRPNPEFKELEDEVNERYERALKQKQARDADSLRIDNVRSSTSSPDLSNPIQKAGQMYYGQIIVKWAANNFAGVPEGTVNSFATPKGASAAYHPARSLEGLQGDLSARWRGNLTITALGGWVYRISAEDFSADYFFDNRVPTLHNFLPLDPNTSLYADPVTTVTLPPPTSYPTSNDFPYSPTLNVNDGSIDGAPIPQLAKDNWSKNGLKPFAEKVIPLSLNLSDPPRINDKQIIKKSNGFTQIQEPPVASKPVENKVETRLYGRMPFSPRPFVSGVSDPSEIYAPRDINTGMTQKEQDDIYYKQQEKIQYDAKANERAAAVFDAMRIEEQLVNLPNDPRPNLGGKSVQQVQRENYERSIKDNPTRVEAYRQATGRDATIKNTTPRTANSNNNNFQTLAGLAGIAATIAALKIGSDLLVNNSTTNAPKIDNINANTQPAAQSTNAKQGVCDAMQPNQCGFQGVQAAVAPIAAGVTANAGLLAQILAAIANLASTIATLFTNLGNVVNAILNNQFITHAMNYITMISAVHNAAMLSRSLLDTLGSALDSGLQIFGLQLRDKDNNQIGISQAIGTTFQNMVKGIIGNENWTALNATWVQANRVYQTGINLLSNVQSIIDSTTAVAELTNNRLGTFMNAVRNAGGVRENAYGAQSENVTRFNANLERMQNLEQGVSNLASITGSIVSVQQSVTELQTNRTEFDNALRDKPVGTTGLAVNTAKAAENTEKKNQSIYTISDFTIVKPPETP